ncbi:uncharacterized protein, partial [Emydura macquarii macquarii]|uniref:uncharacterized protein n=1 Tax=Emydura macquarii macquarii TaxID=1129001 RepID=UPI003529FB97
MATAQRGRKKAQTRRRQKNHGRKSQAKRRKSQTKQKRQASQTPARKRGKSRHGKKCSPTPYDAKMLRQLQQSNGHLSSQAKRLMTSLMNNIYRKVSSEANRLRKQSHNPTIGSSQRRAALQEVMPTKQ